MQISVANSDPLRPSKNFDHQGSQESVGKNQVKVDIMVKNGEKIPTDQSNLWHAPAGNCTETVTTDAKGNTNYFLDCGTRVEHFEKIEIKSNNEGILQF